MTKEKILEVVSNYRVFLEKKEIPKWKYPWEKSARLISTKESLTHCHWMLDQVERFVVEKRIEKAFRWLGFIQGVLWSTGKFTLAELADHNRPVILTKN